jgi:hypothetical protein
MSADGEPQAVAEPSKTEPAAQPQEPDLLEDWSVRGANRYSGRVCKKDRKPSLQFVEFRKGGRMSRDGKFVTVVGDWPYDETVYRLGTPYKEPEKSDPFF